MARVGWSKRRNRKASTREDGFWWYEEDSTPRGTVKLKAVSSIEQPLASSPFDPAPPIHTNALQGSW